MENNKSNKLFIITVASIASTGGLLFGFSTGVISGALPFLKQCWSGLSTSQLEWITTASILGAMIGAIASGRLTDIYGRKNILIVSSIIFAIGAVLSGAATTLAFLAASRIILGIAIGISSFAVPLYISEISPVKNRGALVSSFQLMITVGILLSYLTDLAIADEMNPFSWRGMFYIGVFPAVLLFIGMLFLPETPRFLIAKGEIEEGKNVLESIESVYNAEITVRRIQEDIERGKTARTNWRELLSPALRSALIITIGIMLVQQFTGINTVIYYAPTLFLFAGFKGPIAAIAATVSVGLMNVIATILSMFLIDKIGRRKLYFIGLTGMGISLAGLGSFFLLKDILGDAMQWVTVITVLLYITFFALSIGPLAWLLISEIFPFRLRGMGMSIGSFLNWLFNGIVTFTFLKLAWVFTTPGMEIVIDRGEPAPNPAGSFFVYSIIAFVGIIWGKKFIPETKGISLEQIEDHWRKGKKPCDF